MGFSITGGAKKGRNVEGGREKANQMNNSIVTDSSIVDDFSVAGLGGSNALQGRIVAKKDKGGVKRQVGSEEQGPSPRSLGWIYGDDDNEDGEDK